MGFIGGSASVVQKSFPAGEMKKRDGGFEMRAQLEFYGYPMTAWTFFDAEQQARSMVAIFKVEQRTRVGDYGNYEQGYDGDIFARCTSAFAGIRHRVEKYLGDPIAPVLSAKKVSMNLNEVGEMVGGVGVHCELGKTCTMEGWKATSRAQFNADSGPVVVSMDSRSAQNWVSTVTGKSDSKTGGRCEVRLEGHF